MTMPGDMIGSVMRSTAHSGWAPWMTAARSRLMSALRRLAAVLMTTNGMPLTACAKASPATVLTNPSGTKNR